MSTALYSRRLNFLNTIYDSNFVIARIKIQCLLTQVNVACFQYLPIYMKTPIFARLEVRSSGTVEICLLGF
jgi:hypothetical protein